MCEGKLLQVVCICVLFVSVPELDESLVEEESNEVSFESLFLSRVEEEALVVLRAELQCELHRFLRVSQSR